MSAPQIFFLKLLVWKSLTQSSLLCPPFTCAPSECMQQCLSKWINTESIAFEGDLTLMQKTPKSSIKNSMQTER
jgi:hypothetical protein